MIRLREALRSTRTDEGFSLVEVIVAMVVLGLVSTGILTSANIVIRMTADNRSREVAVNLAEQQLDTDRGILDPFKIHDIPASQPLTQQISGRTYSITQTTSLVSVDGSDITCGSAKSINYRRITVQVDWVGRLPTTTPVQSDTVIAPNGRLNDSSTGSIAVLVSGVNGAGNSGVSVSITPVSGGATALLSQPAVTDVDGCTYALGITPGTYRVAISESGSADQLQQATPDTQPNDIVVTAGATSPVTFTYDRTVTYPLSYVPGVTATLPDKMATTFLSTGQPYATSTKSAAPTSVALYPFTAGYGVVAGAEALPNAGTKCAAEDPAAWGAAPGVKSATRGTAPGQSPGSTASTVAVPMGVFTVKGQLFGSLYITAVGQSSTLNGQPGCATPETFTYSVLLLPGASATFAAPYGTYQLYSGYGVGQQTYPVPGSSVSFPSTQYNGLRTAVTPAGALTLDPRPAS